MARPLPPIVFVKYYEKASTVMGADQLAAALEGLSRESRTLPVAEIGGVRGAILVFIKTAKLPDLLGARRHKNLLVLDLQDTLCFKRKIKNRWLFHGMLFKNRRQLADYGDRERLCEVIYHQADPRYRPHRAGDAELRVGYLGDARSLHLVGAIPGVTFVEGDFFRRAEEFNCHLSLRETGRDFLYKPGTKVSIAAACGAALITTADESALEMLGPDYPYYTRPDLESVRAAIEHARRTLGGPEWRRARALLEELRERTRLERIAAEYLDYCQRLEAFASRRRAS